MNARDLVLILLREYGKLSSVKIQRLVFLIAVETGLVSVKFMPGILGPVSREIDSALGNLVAEKLVEEKQSGRVKTYRLTEGVRWRRSVFWRGLVCGRNVCWRELLLSTSIFL